MRRHRRLPTLHDHHILWHETCPPKASKPKIHSHSLLKKKMAALAPRPARHERRHWDGADGHVAPPCIEHLPEYHRRSSLRRNLPESGLDGRRRSTETNKYPNWHLSEQKPIRPQHNDLQNPPRILRRALIARASLARRRARRHG